MILPVAVINPPVIILAPVILPVAVINPPVITLAPVMLPVAVINPPVPILPIFALPNTDKLANIPTAVKLDITMLDAKVLPDKFAAFAALTTLAAAVN